MDLVYEEIKSDLKINQVVFMLHGYGADAKDFLSLANYWHRFLPNTLFVAPNAPKKCQINSAGYEWFDLMQTDKNKTTNELIESVDKLKILTNKILKKYNLNYKDVIYVGFSQGTMLAIHTALNSVEIVKGVLGYSGKIYDHQLLQNSINSKVKIFMIHGSKDEVIPLEQMYESFDFLKKLDFEIEYKILENCGHSISAEGTSEGLNFIRKLV